jgi:uncharacterized protein YqjF (DUF2071 family)
MARVDKRMGWAHPLFIHFRIAPARLAARIPEQLAIDRFHGAAYLTVTALETCTLARAAGAPGRGRHRQVSLRTYVTGEHGPGIVVLDSEVDRRLPALRARIMGIPCRVARPLAVEVEEAAVRLETPELAARGRPVDAAPSLVAPHSLESFLLDRFWAYGRMPGGLRWAARLEHPAWHIRTVELELERRAPHPLLDAAEGPVATHLADDLVVALVELAALPSRAPLFAPEPLLA